MDYLLWIQQVSLRSRNLKCSMARCQGQKTANFFGHSYEKRQVSAMGQARKTQNIEPQSTLRSQRKEPSVRTFFR